MISYLHGVDVLAGTYAEEPAAETLARQVVAEIEAADPLPAAPPRVLTSQIPGVPDEQWTEFALAMKTADPKSISGAGAYGMFELKPRRLADLGLMKNVTPVNARSNGRLAWKGEWVAPLTEKKFLSSAVAQYDAFGKSMRAYVKGLEDGSVPQPEAGLPQEMTLSGALAILHRCGPRGLLGWANERFPETVALYEATNGIF